MEYLPISIKQETEPPTSASDQNENSSPNNTSQAAPDSVENKVSGSVWQWNCQESRMGSYSVHFLPVSIKFRFLVFVIHPRVVCNELFSLHSSILPVPFHSKLLMRQMFFHFRSISDPPRNMSNEQCLQHRTINNHFAHQLCCCILRKFFLSFCKKKFCGREKKFLLLLLTHINTSGWKLKLNTHWDFTMK